MFVGNGFDATFQKIDLDAVLVNFGALISFIWVAQFIFDSAARDKLLEKVREDTLGNISIVRSGLKEFHADSHRVNLEDKIISSNRAIIGVNHSSRTLSNNLHSLCERSRLNKEISVVMVDPNSTAARFIEEFQKSTDVAASRHKMVALGEELTRQGGQFKLYQTAAVLKYSFMLFDDCAWVVPGTNSTGRRAVPGILIDRSSQWFAHIESDVEKLVNDSTPQD